MLSGVRQGPSAPQDAHGKTMRGKMRPAPVGMTAWVDELYAGTEARFSRGSFELRCGAAFARVPPLRRTRTKKLCGENAACSGRDDRKGRSSAKRAGDN